MHPAPQAPRHEVDETLAALTLAFADGIGQQDIRKLVECCGTCRDALARLPARMTSAARRHAETEWAECTRRRFSLICWSSPYYPHLLKHIADPPLALYVWGRLTPEDQIGLAVVGSRRATPYGLEACERLSGELAERGATIISGLARGIDAAAHQAALLAGGRTLAVLGSGLDTLYPREHRRLAERIAENGAVLSELPLGTPPLPPHFPRRNRIISGLALGTIVIEAAERSGSLISARIAAEENREVFAVPGPIGSPTSRGTHRLIQNGAKLVIDADDVVDELRPELRAILGRGCRDRETPKRPTDLGALPPDEALVLEALPRAHIPDAERLALMVGLPADRITAALVGLEIKGRIRSVSGGFFRIRAMGGPTR